jgi:hypothetical protein
MEATTIAIANICERTVFVVTGEIKELQATSSSKEMK